MSGQRIIHKLSFKYRMFAYTAHFDGLTQRITPDPPAHKQYKSSLLCVWSQTSKSAAVTFQTCSLGHVGVHYTNLTVHFPSVCLKCVCSQNGRIKYFLKNVWFLSAVDIIDYDAFTSLQPSDRLSSASWMKLWPKVTLTEFSVNGIFFPNNEGKFWRSSIILTDCNSHPCPVSGRCVKLISYWLEIPVSSVAAERGFSLSQRH